VHGILNACGYQFITKFNHKIGLQDTAGALWLSMSSDGVIPIQSFLLVAMKSITNHFRKILFHLRWTFMSQERMYVYLWNRTMGGTR
jgi:hypothetical protein